MKIKKLSEKVRNLIAAGEVIERPASVIKELVENAIDAGAENILIKLEDAGKNLISVSDDGYGMCYEDLELCVERHTTSKLNETDIMNITTFGFRGEALPSIASISRMMITTKTPEVDLGYQLRVTGGSDKKISKVPHNKGTTIEVRDLFFATPARLKFLKSDQSELNAIVSCVKKIAMSHPEIGFKVIHNMKQTLSLEPTDHNTRIYQILGQDFKDNAISVSLSNQETEVKGYISVPTFNKSSTDSQYLFINKRPIKDKLLSSALKIAYMDVLANNRYPVAALFISMNPIDLDVNVHPAKTEVRFKDPANIRSLLINALQQSIFSNSHRATTVNIQSYTGKPGTLGNFILNKAMSEDTKQILQNDNIVANDSGNPHYRHMLHPFINNSYDKYNADSLQNTTQEQKQSLANETLIAEPNLGYAKAQLHKNYIVSETQDAIFIIDQHAAHERILYEKMKKDYAAGNIVKNQLLIPEIVTIEDHEKADLLEEQLGHLEELGLTIKRSSQKHFTVTTIPNIATSANIKQLINDIADELSDLGRDISLAKLVEHVLETIACYYSIRKGRILSTYEMNDLLRQMEETPFSGQCNHGRPTQVKISLKDIEKMFDRS